MSLTLLELFRSVFQLLLFELYLDFGRGGIVGLMGDLRGLSEGFIVVFAASEKQQILKAQFNRRAGTLVREAVIYVLAEFVR